MDTLERRPHEWRRVPGLVSGWSAASLTCLAIIACAPYSAGANPPIAVPPEAFQERAPEEVRIYTANEMPTRPYLEHDVITVAKPSSDKRANLDNLREAAGKRGCDGVILTSDEVTGGKCIVYSGAPPIADPKMPAEAEEPAPR